MQSVKEITAAEAGKLVQEAISRAEEEYRALIESVRKSVWADIRSLAMGGYTSARIYRHLALLKDPERAALIADVESKGFKFLQGDSTVTWSV